MIVAAAIGVVPLLLVAMAIRACAGWRSMGEARFLATLLGGGIGAAGLAIAIVRPAAGPLDGTDAGLMLKVLVLAPVVEELLKGIVAVAIALTFPLGSFRLGFATGACVGLAFAMTENVLYYMESSRTLAGNTLMLYAVQRTVLAASMHAMGPAWIAAMVSRRAPSVQRVAAAFAMAVGAVGWHFLWNALILARRTYETSPFVAPGILVLLVAGSVAAFVISRDEVEA